MAGTHYGYARVSTDRQDSGSDAQRRALIAAGCTEIIEEQASGRKARPLLLALVRRLQTGDVLTVYRFDRISRSVADFYAIGQQISERGATMRSLVEQFDTGTPVGKAMMGIAVVWAQLEAETISERVRNGLVAAKARGRQLGRRRALCLAAEQEVITALAGGAGVGQLARQYGISAATVRRIRSRAGQAVGA